MIPVRFRKQVRALVEEARVKGPKQPWYIPAKPKTPDARKGRFSYASAEFKQDPKQLWADEITQEHAEGVMEAWEQGYIEIAFLRARTAADWEAKHCTPGIYQQLFALVSLLAEKYQEWRKKMEETEKLKTMKESLYESAKTAIEIRKVKLSRSILHVIEEIDKELAPRKQLPLDLEKK
jgi:uncharacterized protein YecA (UPF0149 family)